jgi:hypothetical protein
VRGPAPEQAPVQERELAPEPALDRAPSVKCFRTPPRAAEPPRTRKEGHKIGTH